MAKPIFFFSAISSFYSDLDEYGVQGFSELVSYFEFRHNKWKFDMFHDLKPKRAEFIIDSGAFSAANRKQPILVSEFIAWHKDLLQACPFIKYKAGLDDMTSPETTISNQEATDAADLDLFPTFHLQDPEWVYDWILDRPYKLLGYGGLVSSALTGVDRIKKFLDKSYARIVDELGRKTRDTHLFGVANFELLTGYPCFSGDSASALFKGGYGLVFIPRMNHSGHRDFSLPMMTIPVSVDAPSQANVGAHYNSMRPGVKKSIEEFVASQSIPGFRPFTIEDLTIRHQARKVWNVWMMQKQTEFYPDDCRFKVMAEAAKDLAFF